jgi:SAM-dependent methyltransferase
MEIISLPPGSMILDLPAGTGRHSELFARRGHQVTVADIDPKLVQEATARLRADKPYHKGFVIDASADLPFKDGSYDVALIVDFVDEHLLASIARVVRSGGYLIHESYGAKGENWRQLLRTGRTAELLLPAFEIISYEGRATGPLDRQSEAVKLLGRRRTKAI